MSSLDPYFPQTEVGVRRRTVLSPILAALREVEERMNAIVMNRASTFPALENIETLAKKEFVIYTIPDRDTE